jgi:hypothetical protein
MAEIVERASDINGYPSNWDSWIHQHCSPSKSRTTPRGDGLRKPPGGGHRVPSGVRCSIHSYAQFHEPISQSVGKMKSVQHLKPFLFCNIFFSSCIGSPSHDGTLSHAGTAEHFRVSPPEAVVYIKGIISQVLYNLS